MGGERLKVTPSELLLGGKAIDGNADAVAAKTPPDPTAAIAALPNTATARALAGSHGAMQSVQTTVSGRYTTMATLISNTGAAFAEADGETTRNAQRMSVIIGNGMTAMGDMSAPPPVVARESPKTVLV